MLNKTFYNKSEADLGMDSRISRRDFINGMVAGYGSLLTLGMAPGLLATSCNELHSQAGKADAWWGYGAVGDYAPSPGNPRDMVAIAHGKIRDRNRNSKPDDAKVLDESYDLVVVGGGMSGLSAAHTFLEGTKGKGSCLIIDNHPVFGGESKRNEFSINGIRQIGPQGANDFGIPEPGSNSLGDRIFDQLSIPRSFHYQLWENHFKNLRFGLDNFGPMFWSDKLVDVGHYLNPGADLTEGKWVTNPWDNNLRSLGRSSLETRNLNTWRNGWKAKHPENLTEDEWLDTITYQEMLKTYGLEDGVVRYVDPIIAGAMGLGSDAISAYGAASIGMPAKGHGWKGTTTYPSFPGGNTAFTRFFVRKMIPNSISGPSTFDHIINGKINFDVLDRPNNPVRIRLRSTAVRVEHAGSGHDLVHIYYYRNGEHYKINAKTVVMATGSWVNKHILPELPESHRQAYEHFFYSPFLVVNIALTNWRFLYKLGITACRWYEGFGFFCNIRRSMVTESYTPPLDPEQPVILTMYVPIYYPGHPAKIQGAMGREKLLTTPFSEYEKDIRLQLVNMFGQTGFDPKRDIAGIILNRWGHAYVNPLPGFYFGQNGNPAPKDVIQKSFGRIAIAHSELEGHQNWLGAIKHGNRAANQILEIL